MLNAEIREKIGKGAARAIRRDGKIPAVIYGANQEPIKITISTKEITKRTNDISFMSQLLDIQLGEKTYKVLPKEMETHPVTDVPEHADFLSVDEDTKVKVLVPVRFLNIDKCIGIKKGGTLNIVRHEVEFLVSAFNIPASIDIDISDYNISESIHINSIELPEGAKITIDRNFTIATIAGRTASLAVEEGAVVEGEEESESEEETEE